MSDIIILDETKDKIQKWVANISKNKIALEGLEKFILSLQSISIRDKVVFYRLISVMLNSWMTLMKSISVLEKQEKKPIIKNMYLDFLVKLKEWKNFSECLELYTKNFSESEIGMVRSWEKTGKLNEALLNIADQVEKISSIVTKLKGALIYPTMIILVVLGVLIVMMVVIVPKLIGIFENASALPLSTQILIWVSNFMISYWYILIIFVGLFFVLLSLWKQTESWRFWLDNFKINIPKFWQIYKKYLLSKFARIFSSLIASGVSIVESLKISADAIWNEVYRQRILLLTEDVKSGIKIWESIDSDPLFPDMMVQMIQVWEQTATLDKTIVKVADFYDEQFDMTISTINKLIEPLIIVFLAVTVWFIAVAIMQPIMWLADQVTNS